MMHYSVITNLSKKIIRKMNFGLEQSNRCYEIALLTNSSETNKMAKFQEAYNTLLYYTNHVKCYIHDQQKNQFSNTVWRLEKGINDAIDVYMDAMIELDIEAKTKQLQKAYTTLLSFYTKTLKNLETNIV